MTDEKAWRCPINDFGPEMGLDSGDVETFKKEPEASLARETAQNSIDANDGSPTTWVQYKMFEIDRAEIPGIDKLTELIEACYEYKKELPKLLQNKIELNFHLNIFYILYFLELLYQQSKYIYLIYL